MHRHSASHQGNRPVPPKPPVVRAIVLRSEDQGRRTIGFPPLQEEKRKRVWFDPPWSGRCRLDGEAACTDCLILGIWEDGARLRVRDADALAEFDLLFSSGPRAVRRQCKRVSVHGDFMDVAFRRETPGRWLECERIS